VEEKVNATSTKADPIEQQAGFFLNDGTAPTLEELNAIRIEKEKNSSFEHPALTENVTFRDGRVYFASGKPFNGTLSEKQLFLLPVEGGLFTRSPSRTSEDFVKMPRKL
jgi:hypothetical protein